MTDTLWAVIGVVWAVVAVVAGVMYAHAAYNRRCLCKRYSLKAAHRGRVTVGGMIHEHAKCYPARENVR